MKLQTVKNIYASLNAKNFGGVLTMPRIGFIRSIHKDGGFNGQEMLFSLVKTDYPIRGFEAVTELVYHEMIHQYVDDFLCVVDSHDHGETFKKNYNKFSFGIKKDPNYEYV